MARLVVTGGVVRRVSESSSYAAYVTQIEFTNAIRVEGKIKNQNGEINLTTKNPPKNPYKRNEKIIYQDSNSHNTDIFVIKQDLGPCKYKLKETT